MKVVTNSMKNKGEPEGGRFVKKVFARGDRERVLGVEKKGKVNTTRPQCAGACKRIQG